MMHAVSPGARNFVYTVTGFNKVQNRPNTAALRSKLPKLEWFCPSAICCGVVMIFQFLSAIPSTAEASVGFSADVLSQSTYFSIERNEVTVFGDEAGLQVAVKNTNGYRITVQYEIRNFQNRSVKSVVLGDNRPIGSGRLRENILIWKVNSNKVQKYNICAQQKKNETKMG